jgi:peptidyl-prolyl cis-trans isomerase C
MSNNRRGGPYFGNSCCLISSGPPAIQTRTFNLIKELFVFCRRINVQATDCAQLFAGTERKRVRRASIAARVLLVFSAFSGPCVATDATPGPIDDSVVLVSRGQVSVTAEDLRARLQLFPEEIRSGLVSQPARIRTLLQQILETKEMAEAAKAIKLDQSERFYAEKLIGEWLLLKQLWSEKVRADAIADADIDALAREKYLANPPRRPEEVVVRQVLIRAATGDARARERAESIHKRVAAGESIAELATTFATDSSGYDGGLVRGSLDSFVPEFADAVSRLTARGELAPVVQSEYGFHVVQFEERIPEGLVPFENLAEELRAQVRESVGNQALERQSELFMRGTIEYSSPVIDQISEQPAALLSRLSP